MDRGVEELPCCGGRLAAFKDSGRGVAYLPCYDEPLSASKGSGKGVESSPVVLGVGQPPRAVEGTSRCCSVLVGVGISRWEYKW